MDDILSTLSVPELERIMGVLNRDKQLRERELKRVTRLGVELVREKRVGALVVDDQQKVNTKSRCARCLRTLPAVARLGKSRWRCCVCKHLVCKSCRVIMRKYGDVSREAAHVEPIDDVYSRLRNASAAANHCATDEQRDADVSSSESRGESLQHLSSTLSETNRLDPQDWKIDTAAHDGRNPTAHQRVEMHGKDFPKTCSSSEGYRDILMSFSNMDQSLFDEISRKSDSDVGSKNAKPKKLQQTQKTGKSNEKAIESGCASPSTELASQRNSYGYSDRRSSITQTSINVDSDREVMTRFLQMAGVPVRKQNTKRINSSNKTLSTPKSKETTILTSTPAKTLAIFSQSPLQLASKFFVQSATDSEDNLSSAVKKKILSSGFSDIFQKIDSARESCIYPPSAKHLKSQSRDHETEACKHENTDYTSAQHSTEAIIYEVEKSDAKKQNFRNPLNKLLSSSLSSGSLEIAGNEKSLEEEISSSNQVTLMRSALKKYAEQIGSRVYEFDYYEQNKGVLSEKTSDDDVSSGGNIGDIESDSESSRHCLLLLPHTHQKHTLMTSKLSKRIKARQIERKKRRLKKFKTKKKRSNFVPTPHQLFPADEHIADDEVTQHESQSLKESSKNSMIQRGLAATSVVLNTVEGLRQDLMEREEADTVWICRVCSKTMDLQKKTGDWFHKATKSSAMMYKRSLFDSSISRARSSTLPVNTNYDFSIESHRDRSNSVSLLSLPETRYDAPSLSLSADSNPLRPRSQTLQPRPGDYEDWNSPPTSKIFRKTISEAVLENLRKYVSEPSDDETYMKIERKLSRNLETAAKVENGPKDCSVIKGFPISLCCKLGGSPPLKVRWNKDENEICHSEMCNIETSSNITVLTIPRSELGDSGCYSLLVSNASGFDEFHVNVQVVDVPPPPEKPHVNWLSGGNVRVTWIEPKCGDAPPVLDYLVEVAESSSTNHSSWKELASTNANSYLVTKPVCNPLFRVSARNKHGFGFPSAASDSVRHLAEFNNMSLIEKGADDLRGKYGSFYRIVKRTSGEEYAAKLSRAIKTCHMEKAISEIEILKQLRHPSLVLLTDAYQRDGSIAMITELLTGKKLLQVLADDSFHLSESTCVTYVRQLSAGLRHLHQRSIVHLNLEPDNIMFVDKTSSRIKIIGFSRARTLDPSNHIKITLESPEFAAPEVISGDVIGPEADMWSLGVICYVILTGVSPFWKYDNRMTSSNVLEGNWRFVDAFNDITNDAKNFISSLLIKSSKERLTTDDVSTHDWLKLESSENQIDKTEMKMLVERLQQSRQFPHPLPQSVDDSPIEAHLKKSDVGILASLRAQITGDKQQGEDNRKPEFSQVFDDVEAEIESVAEFRCVISGSPRPDVTWYRDSRIINESCHFRISYGSGGDLVLRIVDVEQADEAEYSVSAKNKNGQIAHSAELIVISPVSVHTFPHKIVTMRNGQVLEDEYVIKDPLGSGRFGKVWLVEKKVCGKKFAAKHCACRRPSQRKEFELEIEIMNELNHPKLLHLYDAFFGKNDVTLVLELRTHKLDLVCNNAFRVTGGELFERIADDAFDLTEQLAVVYLRQICEAIAYMHSVNILHLDLKPENILCLSPDRLDLIKIIDFGFARRYTPNTPLKIMFGTPEFVAPEVVNFDPLGKGTDIWSIGVISYVLLSGLSPFMGDTEQETLSNVTACDVDFDDECFDDISDDAKVFIQKLLSRQERQRPSCEDCLRDPWLLQDTHGAPNVERKSLMVAVNNLKKFVSRRKWLRSINAVRALTRLQAVVKKSPSESTSTP